ncbi:MAG: hypothetical protein KA955_09340 [Prevotella sp.]|nr:hypothetical protein [Prevotella sp.]
MSSSYNQRYPHNVKVSRSQSDSNGTPITDDNGDVLNEIVLESICGLRNINEIDVNSGIAQTDIKISLPLPTIIPVWKVKNTDKVEFANSQTDEVIIGNVSKYRPNNLGIDLFFHING